jgi:hypothetical protein
MPDPTLLILTDAQKREILLLLGYSPRTAYPGFGDMWAGILYPIVSGWPVFLALDAGWAAADMAYITDLLENIAILDANIAAMPGLAGDGVIKRIEDLELDYAGSFRLMVSNRLLLLNRLSAFIGLPFYGRARLSGGTCAVQYQ